ncbi:MAG: type VI secretion system baseplate subunit TssF [Prolixibacteraceae bacterium]|nr:type VI secretion system baseplate subunit TssF [Prolixibacteraceae bacterium]
MSIDSIDTIKRRIMKNASKIWGYKDVQDINSFDPVLSLLIGALAEELHSISREINRTDARIVEKLLELLFSRNIMVHFPAHAVAYAKPLQPRIILKDFYQFYYNASIQKPDSQEGESGRKEIYFTPITSCALFNGEIKYLITGRHLYEMDGMYKELLTEVPSGYIPEYSKFFIGIKLDPLIEKLDGLSFFFSFKNIREESRFYQILHSAKWKINGREVKFIKGVGLSEQEKSLFEVIKKDNNISYKTCHYIHDFYSKKFLTLKNGDYSYQDFAGSEYQPYILSAIKDKKLHVFDKDILWVEVEFPQPVSSDEVNDLIISLNCFPVINRELNESAHSVVKGTNIIPLATDELFFDLNKVSDSSDNIYLPKTSIDNNGHGYSYIIRQGGISRFDSRGAKEVLSHLISLARDEAAAFSAKGADLISSELKQLDQILTRLQQRTNSSGTTDELSSYLILESKAEYDRISVQFWSMAGETANKIRPGSKLLVYKGVDINEKTVTLMTQTAGGRHKMSKNDKINSLRRALLSKGKIVTVEDIKALCFEQFGNDLKNAEVKKGVWLDPSPGKGMSRTMDIYLSLNENNNLTAEDINHKTEELKTLLIQNSVNLLPYRIFTD